MLHGHVLITHPLCFIFCTDQGFIQVLTHIRLTTGYFHPPVQCLLHLFLKQRRIYIHLGNQSGDQALLLSQKTIQQMFLLNLLIAIFHGSLFQIIDCFHRFLCKFLNVHMLASSPRIADAKL